MFFWYIRYILCLIIAVFSDFTVQILWGFFFCFLVQWLISFVFNYFFSFNCEPVFFKVLSVRVLCGLGLKYVLPKRVCVFL